MRTEERQLGIAGPDGAALDVRLLVATQNGRTKGRPAIFYLHGGGLLFGSCDDLPEPYVQKIVEHGYALVSADYPLAPQAHIGYILDAVHQIHAASQELAAPSACLLCGRSAGAYLALMLAHRLAEEEHAPQGVIDFYGYCDLAGTLRPALFQPSAYLRRAVALVTPRVARRLKGTELLTNAPLAERYGLYVYARQSGNWGPLIGLTPENAPHHSLDAAGQASLPPLFIAASRDDQDVPVACSEELAAHAPQAETFFVEQGGHDFDRDPTHREGMLAWLGALDWADRLLGRQAP